MPTKSSTCCPSGTTKKEKPPSGFLGLGTSRVSKRKVGYFKQYRVSHPHTQHIQDAGVRTKYLFLCNRYWQCIYCSQRYQKSHGTSNPGAHLIRVHSIHEEHSAQSKRLKHAQQSIERSMEVAAAAEVRRIGDIKIVIRENDQQAQSQFPPLIAESLVILYVTTILYSIRILICQSY